jgi:hypothetical protein
MMDVRLFRIVTGEEVIAEVVDENASTFTLRNGLVVLPTAQSIGFAPWATVVSKEKPELKVSRTHIVYVGEVEHSIREKYDSIYGSKLVTPEPKSLILS